MNPLLSGKSKPSNNNNNYNNNNNGNIFLNKKDNNNNSKFKQKFNHKKFSNKKFNTDKINKNEIPSNINSIKKDEIDSIIGPLLNNPQSMGFSQFKHEKRVLPRFLIGQRPQLVQRPLVQDPWDKANQLKMNQLESSINDLNELYETLKKMRNFERRIMESKGLVDKPALAKDLNDAIIFQGTCMDMCPTFERSRRNVEHTVLVYERDSSSDKKASRSKALKVFARPAAAAEPPLPSDVRPPHILVKSLDYIIDNLLSTLPDSESFLWDRMRSIRQDFTYQNYSGPEAVDCNERIVRIHLLILHIMVKSNVEFSLQQELEQLHKSLITLSEIYDDVRSTGGVCPNEAEFRAYALLSKIRDPEYDKTIQELPSSIFQDNLVQFALCFRRIISNSSFSERGYMKTESCLNFYSRFFQLLNSGNVPILLSFFLEIYLNEIRFYSLKALSLTLNKKYKPVSISIFKEYLSFNDFQEIEAFCKYYSIDIQNDFIDLKSLTHHSHKLAEKKPLKQTILLSIDSQLLSLSYIDLINSGLPNFTSTPINDTKNVDNIIDSIPLPIESNIFLPPIDLHPEEVTPKLEPPIIKPPIVNISTPNDNIDNKPTISTNNKVTVTNNQQETIPQTISFSRPEAPSFFQTSNSFNIGKQDTSLKQTFKTPNLETNFNKISTPNMTNFFQNQPKIDVFKTPVTKASEESNNGLLSNINNILNDKVPKTTLESSPSSRIQSKPKALPASSFTPLASLDTKPKSLEKSESQPSAGSFSPAPRSSSTSNNDIKIDTARNESDIEVTQSINRKMQVIEELSTELFDAFFREKIYLLSLETKADMKYSSILKTRFINRWRSKYDNVINHKKRETMQILEFQNVINELGKPNFKEPSEYLFTPNFKKTKHTNLLNSINKSLQLSPISNEVNIFSTKIQKDSKIWEPFNLDNYYETIASRCPNFEEAICDIFIYSKNYNPIIFQWLLRKFNINDYRIPEKKILKNVSISINGIDDKYDTSLFNNVQLLVFNTGVTNDDIFDLDLKLKQDGEDMIKLMTDIAVNTNIKFDILVVYWDSNDIQLSDKRLSKLLQLGKVSKNFRVCLNNIIIVRIGETDPHNILLHGLNQISTSFKYSLTDKGRINLSLKNRRSLAGIGPQEVQLRATDKLDAKLKKIQDNENAKLLGAIDKRNTYQYLFSHVEASPRKTKRKLPVLLSESKSNKFRTPSGRNNTSSLSSFGNLSHLAKKGKNNMHNSNNILIFETPTYATINNRSYMTPGNVTKDSNDISYIRAQYIQHIPESNNSLLYNTPTNPPVSQFHAPMISSPDNIANNLSELRSLIDTVKKR
ncbi:hypothetical protein TBLA_0A04070 [Henningerozyma blattae CBS 6284]|uniref:Nuclear mRNA export factor n=1 Tax=Henningerozyma blattae (strain ATCC 34711 / CBS 6284 / DSM 70876 / NBRC 10599 / NRRL Y-10934 / UCD 77-7) TaxID=1071380 RepID=I2GVQ1_HENB6|nr:hypothetical protein TBLA_0A04070 [Tetrapisispora blattae CBS 6284]CCH58203.1 hypothetical protein TBLA_0A04070 [Tetrapisispora blattae CBS 6284]